MVTTQEELFSLIDGLRKRGVLGFELGDLKLSLHPYLPDDTRPTTAESLSADDDEIPDHILFHSSE